MKKSLFIALCLAIMSLGIIWMFSRNGDVGVIDRETMTW